MCGRYETNHDNSEMKTIIDSLRASEDYEYLRNGDVYPTDKSAVLIADKGAVKTEIFDWGYDKYDGKGVLINARSETVTDKPMFSADFKQRRCLIPATGFYEWSAEKNNFIFRTSDTEPLFMAALYKTIRNNNRFVILTKDAEPPVKQIHHRMPVLIQKKDIVRWLINCDFAEYALNAPLSQQLLCFS